MVPGPFLMTRLSGLFWLVVAMAVAAAGDAPDQGAPEAFLNAWRVAAARPEQALVSWRTFVEERPDHELNQLATLMLGVCLLRQNGDEAEVDTALECFRLEYGKEDDPDAGKPGRSGRSFGRSRRVQPRRERTNGEEPEDEDGRDRESDPATPLEKHFVETGKGWIARVEMVRLGRKLRAYYRRRVCYPQSLDELVDAADYEVTADDLVDPFGKRYEYKATARKLIPDMPRQAYTLRCTTTGAANADLDEALREAFEPVKHVAVSTLRPKSNEAYVRRKRKDGSFGPVQRWLVGETRDDLVLWAVYESYIVVGQKDRPKVVAAE